MDDDHSGQLSLEEFINGLKDTGLILEQQQYVEMFREFDRDGSGQLKYDEFIRAIRVSV